MHCKHLFILYCHLKLSNYLLNKNLLFSYFQLAWLLILFAENVYYLYAARILSGFVGGGVFVMVPLFLNEIASDSVRGLLGSSK